MKSKTALLLLATAWSLSSVSRAETLFGLSGNNIVSFDSANPGVITFTKPISGLGGGETLLSIDFRPQDSVLYGYSSGNGIFSLNLSGVDAAATLVVDLDSVTPASPTATGPLSTFPPSGTISIDFNPAANALRIIDSNDNNYRRSFASGAFFNDGLIDLAGNGAPISIVAEAYTRNAPNFGTTQLLVVDALTNSLYLQNPPNDGTLSLIGSLGIDIPSSGVGFEISGTTAAFLSANSDGLGNAELYTVNVGTGATSLIGTIGAPVTDVAAAVPEPSSIALLLLGGSAGLLARRRSQAGRPA